MKYFLKSFFGVLALSMFLSLVVFGPAHAQNMLNEFAGKAGYPTDASQTVENNAHKIINVALSLSGLLFLGMGIYAGMRWLTAMGNEENVTKAKDALEAAAIGMVIISLSYAITNQVFKLVPVSAPVTPPPAVVTSSGACKTNSDCSGSTPACSVNNKCVAF